MPEYYDGPSGNNIPQKPRSIDEAAQASLDEAERENAKIRKEDQAERDKNQQLREAHGRRAEGTKAAGLAERMYGQDRFINTDDNRNPDPARSVRRTELTPAQQAMREKREAARELDRQAAAGTRHPDITVPELSKSDQSPSR